MSIEKSSYEERYNKLVDLNNRSELEKRLSDRVDKVELKMSLDMNNNVKYYESLVRELREEIRDSKRKGDEMIRSAKYNLAICIAAASVIFSSYLIYIN